MLAELTVWPFVADTGSGVQQAMGRVLGSLCVLTSRDDDAESGMLASWVSICRSLYSDHSIKIACRKFSAGPHYVADPRLSEVVRKRL